MLALLARAATLGSAHAMASLAQLVDAPGASVEELRLAAEHLEAFAERLMAEERRRRAEREALEESEEEEEEEVVDQEHNCLHRRREHVFHVLQEVGDIMISHDRYIAYTVLLHIYVYE